MQILSPGSDFDEVNLGSTGFAQLGLPHYEERAQFEGEYLLERLPKLMGAPPPNFCAFKWKAFPYTMGAIQLGNYQETFYHEIVLYMDWNDPRHVKYYHKCEEKINFDKLEEEIMHLWLQRNPPVEPEDIDHLINPDKL